MNRKIILLPLSVAALLVLGACGKTTPAASSAPASSTTPTSSSKKEIAPTAITVAELIAWNAEQDTTKVTVDGDTLYTMSGILEGWAGATGTDDYGDCYLTDPTTLKSVLVYGSTTTKTCIAGDAGSYAFTNPKDAKTTLKDYKNGEKATMTFIRESYKGTLEILGYFTAHVADTTKYAVAAPVTVANGSYTVDKTTAAYGETVTVVAAPATDYKVDYVTVKNTQGKDVKATVDATDATKYTFTATCVNSPITVAFTKSREARTFKTVDLLATKANGDSVTFTNVEVIYNAVSTSYGGNIVVANDDGYAVVYIAKANVAADNYKVLAAAKVNTLVTFTGTVAVKAASTATFGFATDYIDTLTAASVGTGTSYEYSPAAIATAAGSFATSAEATTYLQSLETAAAATAGITAYQFVKVTSVKVIKYNGTYSYFSTADADPAAQFTTAKAGTASAKTMTLGLFSQDPELDATKTYDITFMFAGANKAFTDAANNTIIRGFCPFAVEHVA